MAIKLLCLASSCSLVSCVIPVHFLVCSFKYTVHLSEANPCFKFYWHSICWLVSRLECFISFLRVWLNLLCLTIAGCSGNVLLFWLFCAHGRKGMLETLKTAFYPNHCCGIEFFLLSFQCDASLDYAGVSLWWLLFYQCLFLGFHI